MKFVIFLSNDTLLIPKFEFKYPWSPKKSHEVLYVKYLTGYFKDVNNAILEHQEIVRGPLAFVLRKIEDSEEKLKSLPLVLFDDPQNFAEFCYLMLKSAKVSINCFCDMYLMCCAIERFYFDFVLPFINKNQ